MCAPHCVSWRGAPLVTAVSILTLALGIGANTAIFNVVYAVLLRPLPYANADRLVVVAETQRDFRTGVGPGQFTEWVARNRAFESLSAETGATFNLSGVGAAQRVTGAMVTPSKFRTLVMPPVAGRYFVDEEATPGREHVVVLSYGLFTQQFGGDAGIVGRTISLSETPYVVVGVAPPDYAPESYGEQLWVPLALTADHKTKFNEHWLLVYGKLKAGVSLAAAQRDMERVTREIAALQPASMIDRSVRVVSIRDDLAGDYERQLGVLFGAAGLILLLACSNIAGLILARLTTRRREIAVRLALGAGRGRVVRLLLTESLVLAAMGGVASLAVASGATMLLLRIAPASVPRLDQAGVGAATLPFVIAATLVAGLVLGIFPALRSTRGDVRQALRESGRTSSAAGPRDRARNTLVVGEIALALVLMTGARAVRAQRAQSRKHRSRLRRPWTPVGTCFAGRFAIPVARPNCIRNHAAARVGECTSAIARRRGHHRSAVGEWRAGRPATHRWARVFGWSGTSGEFPQRLADLFRDDGIPIVRGARAQLERPCWCAAGRRDQRGVGPSPLAE
jgi:predicted permease